ncbi:MAG: TIM barrel protein [Bryobacter sp.]|nr:TIM barrel protein [Bryobacter sp.]
MGTGLGALLAQTRRWPIGYNTYCLRGLRMTDRQHIDQAVAWKLDALFLQDTLDPRAKDPAHWIEVRRWTMEAGLHLETGGGGILPKGGAMSGPEFDAAVANLRYQIKRARAMGSPLVRCVCAGDRFALPLPTIEANQELVVKLLQTVRQETLDAGVKLAIEIHKDFQAWEHAQIIEAAGKDFVGTYLDTGNPVFALEDPMLTLETLAPYVLTFHLRDSVVYEHPRGIAVQWVPLGEGTVDFPALVKRAGELLKPEVRIYIKPITGRPPYVHPVGDDAFWARWYPKARAREYARFVALAKRGRPYEKTVVQMDTPGTPTPAA